MGIKIERCLTCGNNPTGFSPNLGYYALAECIIMRTNPSVALSKWCGIKHDPFTKRKYTPRAYVKPDPQVDAMVVQIYFANPNLMNTEIAKMVGRSKTFVSKILLSMGIKRNRWTTKRGTK